MTFHQFGPIFPAGALSLLAAALSGWSLWRVKFAYRARGRQAVERLLSNRGEALVAIEELPVSVLRSTSGLCGVVIFQVVARTPDGAEQTYEWAYAPGVFPWETEGIQRLAHGVWIAA
jgi:hypothetical protein